MLRILIADDHDVVRCGLRKIFEARPAWKIVAEVADGREAVAKAIETVPDVAIVDYAMPSLNGAEITRRIRKSLPNTEILIVTMYESEQLISAVLRAGARGYLFKSDASGHLLAAVEALASHKPYLTAKVSDAVIHAVTAGRGRRKAFSLPVQQQIEPLLGLDKVVTYSIANEVGGGRDLQLAHDGGAMRLDGLESDVE